LFPWLHEASWAVLDGFGYVVGFDDISIFQVSQGAAYLEDAVEGTGGEIKLFHGRLEQALGRFFRLAEFPYLGGCHLGIAG